MRPFLALVFVGLLAFSAEALCIPKHITPPDAKDPFTYLDSVIDSLGWVKQGFSGVRVKRNPDLGDLLHKVKAAPGDYRCAAAGLTSFTDSLSVSPIFFCKYPAEERGERFVAWHQDVTYWGLEPRSP